MKTFLRLIGSLCFITFCFNHVQAAPAITDEAGFQLTIELRDGSRVVGKTLNDTPGFHSGALGDLKLSWSGIRAIEFAADTDTARLTATNGDGFSVQFAADTLSLQTSFGKTDLAVKQIRSIKVSPRIKPNIQTPAAAGGEAGFQLTIDLRDGSHVIGKGLDDTLVFHSPAMGDLKLGWAGIRSLEYASASTDTARLTATNGDVYEVQFAAAALRVETSFGKNELPVKLIRSIKVSPMTIPGQLPPGLVALWSGEGDGSDSAGGNNGTLSGNTTFAEGKVGQAFSFNGVNSFVKIPQSPNLNFADQITISFWMKADADNTMNTICEGLVTSDFYVIEIDNGPRWGVNFAISTMADQPIDQNGITSSVNFTHISQANGGGASVTPGQWHHIAATYDGTKLQLYVDGRPWGNPMPHTGTIRPMLPESFVSIGSEDGRTTCPGCVANRYFKGSIDEVAIYKRALSASEIQAICTEQKQP